MKVILLKEVKGVGKRFDEKEISNGYAANFLIPKKLAVAVTGSAANTVKALKEKEERERGNKAEAISENISKLKDFVLKISLKANEKGHLFAAIDKEKISELLKKEGIELSPEHIGLKNNIKELGTFEVPVEKTHFTLEVTSQ